MRTDVFFSVLLLMSLRYVVMAGLAFLAFYVVFRSRFSSVKIQRLFPKSRDYRRELSYSLCTLIIFSAYALLIFRTPLSNYTRLYSGISDFGAAYFICSILIAIVVHDTYFYWTHRLMHHPRLFRYFHLVHHKSTNPSPWTAYSFHPLEALVEAGILALLVFTVPMHRYALALFLLFMLGYNIYGHLGYEVYPGWLVRSRVGRWLNTSTSHNMHHHYFKGNYGLYFRFWDIVMQTTHPDYETTLDEMCTRKT